MSLLLTPKWSYFVPRLFIIFWMYAKVYFGFHFENVKTHCVYFPLTVQVYQYANPKHYIIIMQ